ncbi:glycoside hydrolase family 25 protein [Ruminococcaceae bacterium OttesenSCG-928-N02]|nr:glycoside hydrolase family 25 protein [Ruminococcaceae bacterium OttesenSCG-928-N02]
MNKTNGIDVSRWQGKIDWQKVKASGVTFAILRAGYGSSITYKDPTFEENYAQCKRAGIHTGAYWYSYATTTEQAVQEMRTFLQVVRGKRFEYPLYFDQEYEPSIKALSKAQRTAIVKSALGTLQKAGYYAGLYASTDWITNWLNYTQLSEYDVWAAQYAPICTCPLPYGVWQYTGSGTCPGVSGKCDLDYAYKDYPSIMRAQGLNGYPVKFGRPPYDFPPPIFGPEAGTL